MTTPTIRSTTTGFANASSFSAAIPGGTLAGDTAILFVGGGYGISGVPDISWTILNNSGSSPNINGSSFWKVLTSADITAGNINVTMGGSYWFSWTLVVFVGSAAPRTGNTYSQNSSGATSRTLASGTTVITGDLVLLHSAQRNGSASTNAISVGSVLVAQFGDTNCSSVVNEYVAVADGSFSANFTYSVSGNSDFQQIVSVGPVTANIQTSRVALGAVAQFNPGEMLTSRVALATIAHLNPGEMLASRVALGALAQLNPGEALASRVSIGVVVDTAPPPPPPSNRRQQALIIN